MPDRKTVEEYSNEYRQQGYVDYQNKSILQVQRDNDESYRTQVAEEKSNFNYNRHVEGLDATRRRMYNFVTAFDEGRFPVNGTGEGEVTSDIKVQHWYDWFGAGADSKMHTGSIMNRVIDYYNEFFEDEESGLAADNIQISVGDAFYDKIRNSNLFVDRTRTNIKDGMYIIKASDSDTSKYGCNAGDYLYFSDNDLLFSLSGNLDTKGLNKGYINVQHNEKAFIKLAETYNRIANDNSFKKLFWDGADDGLFGTQYGDMLEEVGDMLDNVRSYVREEIPEVYRGNDITYNPTFVPLNPDNSIGGFLKMAENDIEFHNGKYATINKQGQLTNTGASKHNEYQRNELYRHWNSFSKTNIADLTIYAAGGNDYDLNLNSTNHSPMSVMTDPKLKEQIRDIIANDLLSAAEKSKAITYNATFGKIGNQYGYMIHVPAANKSGDIPAHGDIDVFIPNFFDIERQNAYTARPDVRAQMAIESNKAHQDNNYFNQIVAPQPTTTNGKYIDIADDGTIVESSENSWQNVKYNVMGSGANSVVTINVNGRNYNLNEKLNTMDGYDTRPELNAEDVLQDYLTLMNVANATTSQLYNSQKENGVLYGDSFTGSNQDAVTSAKRSQLDKMLVNYFGNSGLTGLQLLALFDNPELGSRIQYMNSNTEVIAAMNKQLQLFNAAILKYYQ